MKILIVCLGNICRSPIAEGVLKYKAGQRGLDWVIDSAGTNSYHTGEKPHHYSQKICRQHGIDISGQRARQFCYEDFDKYDKIYAMATDVYREIKKVAGNHAGMEKVSLFLNEHSPGSDDSVPDPWYGTEEGYLPVYTIIADTCDIIIEKYSKEKM